MDMQVSPAARGALLVILSGSAVGCSTAWHQQPTASNTPQTTGTARQTAHAPAQTPATAGTPTWQDQFYASAAPETDGFPDSPGIAPTTSTGDVAHASPGARNRMPGALGSTTTGQGTSDDGLGWYSGTVGESLASSLPPTDEGGSANISQVTDTFEGADFDPVVSRDGTFVVFASTQHRATADIYLKRMGSSVLTQITSDPGHDMMPSISPDGQWIAFTSNRSGNWDIYVMPIDGGKALQLTTDMAPDLHPSWSPDGNSLVFCRFGEAARRWELWVLDMRTPTLSFFIGEGLFPEWCPIAGTGSNGSDRILYQRSRERGSRSFGVWTIDYGNGEAANPMLIASSASQACINPTWSPDGQWVAFAGVPNDADWAEHGAPRPSDADLYLASVEGGNRVPLTSGRGVDLMPTFAPDGTLFFISDRSGHDNLWMMTTHQAIQTATGRVPMGAPVFAGAEESPEHDGH